MKQISLILVALSAIFLGGCNTIDGAGEDIETAGDEIDEAL